jgi:uncharacterized membrane protein
MLLIVTDYLVENLKLNSHVVIVKVSFFSHLNHDNHLLSLAPSEMRAREKESRHSGGRGGGGGGGSGGGGGGFGRRDRSRR